MLRTVIFWLHLLAGLVAGLVIFVMSATGVLLTYEKQMIAWADRSDAALPPAPGTSRLDADALIAAAQAARPGEAVTNLTVFSAAGAPALATIAGTTLALNPYTGLVLGESAPRLRAFFRGVTRWHRYLGAESGPIRRTMRAITGWSNFLFLLIVLGGAYLWIPRKWTWAQLRPVLWFRSGLRGKARDFNWHNTIGVWCCIPLAIVIIGALPISFPWANRAVFQIVGEPPPTPPAGRAGAGGGVGGAGRPGSPRGGAEHERARQAPPTAIEPFWQRAERHVNDWRTIGARVGGNGPIAFTIDRGSGGQPQLRDTLTVNRSTGEVIRLQRWDDQTIGRRLRSFLRFAHTGEYFGLAGQTVAGLASAGGAFLVWTGLALALRRFKAWRARRRTLTTSTAARSNAA